MASLAFNVSFSFIWKLKSCALHHVLNVSKASSAGLKCKMYLQLVQSAAGCLSEPSSHTKRVGGPLQKGSRAGGLGLVTSQAQPWQESCLYSAPGKYWMGHVREEWTGRICYRRAKWYSPLRSLRDGHLVRGEWVDMDKALRTTLNLFIHVISFNLYNNSIQMRKLGPEMLSTFPKVTQLL